MSGAAADWRDLTFDFPAYIVLDVPSPVAETIREYREKFDPDRAKLPVEITLTGSCGTGLISHGQTLGDVADLLEKAAAKIPPIVISFDRIDRFPQTDIYFLSVKDSPELLQAQKIISECGIRFDPSPYPYHPHCTIVLRKEIRDDRKLTDLFFLNIPKEPISLNLLSVYGMKDVNSCEILYKIPLS